MIHNLPSRSIHIRHPTLKNQPEELKEIATEREKDGDRVVCSEHLAIMQIPAWYVKIADENFR